MALSADRSCALDRRIGGLLRDPVDKALRVLIATLFQGCDRRKTVLGCRGVAGGEDRGLRELQGRGDARVAFFAELRLKRRQRLGVVRPEYVFGRGETLFRIGIGEGQRSHRALDGASKRVVDADLLEGGDAGIGNGFAGLGVEHRAGGGLVGDDFIGWINEKAIVGQRFENGRGLRRRLGGQLSDRGCGLGKLVVEEFRQRVVDGVGAGDRCERYDSEDTDRT